MKSSDPVFNLDALVAASLERYQQELRAQNYQPGDVVLHKVDGVEVIKQSEFYKRD